MPGSATYSRCFSLAETGSGRAAITASRQGRLILESGKRMHQMIPLLMKGKSKVKSQRSKIKSAPGADGVRHHADLPPTAVGTEHTSLLETLLTFDLPFKSPGRTRRKRPAIAGAGGEFLPRSLLRSGAWLRLSRRHCAA